MFLVSYPFTDSSDFVIDSCSSASPVTSGLSGMARSLGFHVDFTPPHTPQHNKVERGIGSIDFKARVSSFTAPHLDFNTHYLDASLVATYLHNRVVGSKGKTPFEMVKGSQPMTPHGMPFGCSGAN